jgi:hypothetical protein
MSYISTICRLANFFIEGAELADKVSKASRTDNRDLKIPYIAAAVMKAVACSLNCTCAGADAFGVPVATLCNIKSLEVLARFGNSITTAMALSSEASVRRLSGGSTSLSQYIWAFETGYISPFAGTLRALHEGCLYNERRLLEMSPEQLALEKRSIFDEDCEKKIGERPVTREECIKNVEELPSMIAKLQTVETITRLGPCSAAVKVLEDLGVRMEQVLA